MWELNPGLQDHQMLLRVSYFPSLWGLFLEVTPVNILPLAPIKVFYTVIVTLIV